MIDLYPEFLLQVCDVSFQHEVTSLQDFGDKMRLNGDFMESPDESRKLINNF